MNTDKNTDCKVPWCNRQSQVNDERCAIHSEVHSAYRSASVASDSPNITTRHATDPLNTGKQIQLSNLELQRAHSPEYYKNRNQADDLRLCAEIYGRDSREFQDMLKRQRETQPDYKAHAIKLAEALRDLLAAIKLGTLNVRKDFSLMVAHASATKALVAWEGAQQ